MPGRWISARPAASPRNCCRRNREARMSLAEQVKGLAHIGLRVHDLARARAFYEQLGFVWAWGPFGEDAVAGMTHACGLELNFIVNAPEAARPNILMDVPDKYPGITHVALKIADVGKT